MVTATDRPARARADAYHLASRWYDWLIEPLLAGAKEQALAAFALTSRMAVLDVGCGTGAMLERFGRSGCELFGLDASPGMLARARQRLGSRAELRPGSADELPFEDARFDLVSFTMVLHELPLSVRTAAVREALRVLRPGGRLLVLDYAARSERSLLGLAGRAIVLAIERGAGSEHWAGYQSFVARGGVDALCAEHGLVLAVRRTLVYGTFLVALALPSGAP